MINKERLEQLIKEEKTIYTIQTKLNLYSNYTIDSSYLYCNFKGVGYAAKFNLEELFETEEEADHYKLDYEFKQQLKGTITYDFSDISIWEEHYYKSNIEIEKGCHIRVMGNTCDSCDKTNVIYEKTYIKTKEEYQKSVIEAINAWKGQFE